MSQDWFSPPAETKVLEHRLGHAWLGTDGVVRITWQPGADIDLPAAEDATAKNAALVPPNGKCPALIDVRELRSANAQARAYFAGPVPAQIQSAVALVVKSRVSRMIGNFFLGINRLDVPIQLFSEPAEALDWLKGFVE